MRGAVDPGHTPVDRVLAALDAVGFAELQELPGWSEASPEMVAELLEGFAAFVADEIVPLNAPGDREGCRLDPTSGRVHSPAGFADAYQRYVAAGWPTVPFDEVHGGGGMPWSVGVAMQDILASANMALSLCPMLTQGAVELLARWGTPEQQARYLPKLVSGEWTGTMNLTEPDAGSDVGAVRTMARPAPGGAWRVSGTKIFITWGDHDLTDDTLHLVLARTPDAPSGTRGLSLFAVPARLHRAGASGASGASGAGGGGGGGGGGDGDGGGGPALAPNGVRCVSIEHKLGIHASPTCVMEFDGAEGELVGELHGGMRAMFTMMNAARLSVGVEGIALAERGYQAALAYACQRVQGRLPGDPSGRAVAIVEHPDVRRMLATMRASVDAARLVVYTTAHAMDVARRHPDARRRAEAADLVGFLVPLAKAWSTDLATDITSLALQVHGGAGYIEETGVAQHYRDARITAIYEGTNGVQAIDLVQRKLGLGEGSAAATILQQVRERADQIRRDGHRDEAEALMRAAATWRHAADLLIDRRAHSPLDALAGATPFLTMTANLVGGWLLAGRLVAPGTGAVAGGFGTSGGSPRAASDRDRKVARFFLTQLLPRTDGLVHAVRGHVDDLVI